MLPAIGFFPDIIHCNDWQTALVPTYLSLFYRQNEGFENIKTVLGELGADTADVLKTTVYLTNMADFGEVNKLYAEVFGPDYPARTCVEVSALPMGLSIEVECIARAK